MEPNKKGLLQAFNRFLKEPMPKGVNWPNALGSCLLALVVVQVITGILLSLYYSPNADVAHDSVRFIEQQVVFGSLIRGIHYFSASAMMVVIFLHLARTFFSGAYKPPRQWTWIFGVALLLVVVGFAFTGYLLPWDMKAYFATKVGLNIAGMTPIVGDSLKRILQGGSELGMLTLSRFFALHVVVLPLSLVLLIALHITYIRMHGPTPLGRGGEPGQVSGTFFPQQLFRDSVVAAGVIGLIFVLALKFGAPLEAPADPNDTSYIPRPDWYFYGAFQLLKLFEGRFEVVGAIVLPGLFLAVMVLLPFLDRSPGRSLKDRPAVASIGAIALLSIVILTAVGAYTGEKQKESLTSDRSVVDVEGEIEETFVVDPAIGKQLYDGLKCAECHALASEGVNNPPGLEFSGNKYRQSWLVAYLQQPHRVRWQGKNRRPVARMPNFDLTDREALNLSVYLLELRRDNKFPEPEFDWAEADSEMVDSGKELTVDYGCMGCHRIGDEGQNVAPELSHAGSKLREAYLFSIVQEPDKVVPGTSMKNFQLEVEDIEDIVAYLRLLE